MKTVSAGPRASLLIESMRDFGYSLESALADIIDNSITAGSHTIRLFAEADGANGRIGILDDGVGMANDELIAAMRLGNRSPREDRSDVDLGRFGLGLKTASFSQSRRLTVVSRHNGKLSAACWDLDHVVKVDDWLLQVPDDPNLIPWADQLGDHGTLVVWEKLDRIIDADMADPDLSAFYGGVDEARDHLELVFHRFLAGEPGKRKISILMNERPLEPFDPFFSTNTATIAGPIEKIRVHDEEVIVQSYTLPHKQKVSTADWNAILSSATTGLSVLSP
jgi:hypothetical protein